MGAFGWAAATMGWVWWAAATIGCAGFDSETPEGVFGFNKTAEGAVWFMAAAPRGAFGFLGTARIYLGLTIPIRVTSYHWERTLYHVGFDGIGALRGQTIITAGVLGGAPMRGTYCFYYCPGVLGGNTHD
ncbi:hypothetical protein Tco_1153636, partial [Tanacetum coccineum]